MQLTVFILFLAFLVFAVAFLLHKISLGVFLLFFPVALLLWFSLPAIKNVKQTKTCTDFALCLLGPTSKIMTAVLAQ